MVRWKLCHCVITTSFQNEAITMDQIFMILLWAVPALNLRANTNGYKEMYVYP